MCSSWELKADKSSGRHYLKNTKVKIRSGNVDGTDRGVRIKVLKMAMKK